MMYPNDIGVVFQWLPDAQDNGDRQRADGGVQKVGEHESALVAAIATTVAKLSTAGCCVGCHDFPHVLLPFGRRDTAHYQIGSKRDQDEGDARYRQSIGAARRLDVA